MSLLHRQLRRSSTEPEQILWEKLRNRQLGGFKIRRQHPIGPYVADFVCISPKLVVELDGRVHEPRRAYDKSRTSYLISRGFRVLRFRNVEVYRNKSAVLRAIEAALVTPSVWNKKPLLNSLSAFRGERAGVRWASISRR